MRKPFLAWLIACSLAVTSGPALASSPPLTREEFAVQLAQAANYPNAASLPTKLPPDLSATDPAAPAVLALMDNGVLKGYPDGRIGPTDPVTYLQAMAMIGRSLDLPETAPAPGQTVDHLTTDSWGYNIYSWLEQQNLGLQDLSPNTPLTADQGTALISQVFGTDQKALDLLQSFQSTQSSVQTFSADITDQTSLVPSATYAATTTELLPGDLGLTAHLDLVMPDQMALKATIQLKPPGQSQPVSLPMDMYIVPEGVYLGRTPPSGGPEQWLKMPGQLSAPMLKQLKQGAMEPVPTDPVSLFHYRLIGQKTVGGVSGDEIAFYGRVSDITSLLPANATSTMPPDDASPSGPISFHGVLVIDPNTKSLLEAEITEAISLKSGPISLMDQQLTISNLTFNQPLTITLPPAAAAAIEPPLPPTPSAESP